MKKVSFLTDYELLSKLFFRLLPFQVMLLVINTLNSIVDTLFASNFIGKTAMSALGLYAPMNHLLFAMSIVLVSGSQLMMGEALGRNQKDQVKKLFSVDVSFAIRLSVITAVLVEVAVLTNATSVLVNTQEELSAFNSYLLGQSVGIPALVLGQQLFAFLSMENQTRRTMIASLCCIVANTTMNFVFVVIFRMGTFGLGLGSSIGLWFFCMVMAVHYLSGKSELRFTLGAFNLADAKSIFVRGYPGAISRFLEMFRCVIVNALILEFVGAVGLSSFAASNSVMGLFWPIPFGMCAVLRMILGITIGEEDRKSMKDIMKIFLTRGLMLQCLVTIFIIVMAKPFTMMFYRDPSDPVFDMTVKAFLLLPLCMPLAVISLGMTGYAQAARLKKLSIVLPIVDGAVGVVACSIILIPRFEMTGLYIANILNGVLCLIVILVFCIINCGHFPKNMEEFLMIPDSFGASENERIDIEIRDMKGVLEISGRVIDFCSERGIDHRRSCFAGLALEEMAGNVVEHGFEPGKNGNYIDIRVVHKDDDVILRIRDNCRSFDPLKRTEIHKENDVTKNVGIRLAVGIAKKVNYQNLLGLNVTTIRI
ncbi:MAG: ATP-binding protein [Lachnospiraceae bacterium]|nr:ATP-binding protein [Lachnospiraceae bacterium]